MKEVALKSLKESIKHWERVVADVRTPVGRPYCALCRQFNTVTSPGCNGCPVSDAGHLFCADTPYERFARLQRSHGVTTWRALSEREAVAKLREAAQAEVDFLRGLLPKEEGPCVKTEAEFKPATVLHCTPRTVTRFEGVEELTGVTLHLSVGQAVALKLVLGRIVDDRKEDNTFPVYNALYEADLPRADVLGIRFEAPGEMRLHNTQGS